MPSWEEPFGLVALEGMAMRKPVVATRAGGVPEFVQDGQTGVLVPPRDPDALAEALLALIADPARARAIGARGRRHVEDAYTERHYVDNVRRVLLSAAR
jgi:glycosyltransferase involved in cell wall biosynthesis